MKKRKKLIVIMSIILILAIGIGWQHFSIKKVTEKYTAPGGFLDVGSYNMHFVCKGNGETAIVFIEGSGTPCAYTDFYELQNFLSQYTMTLSFDHAGTGWSSETDEPRTIINLVVELSDLIDTVAYGRQVILVCHSLGALEAIHYAQTNSDNVKGIIFLDCGSPEYYSEESEASAKLLSLGIGAVRSTGILRALDKLGVTLPIYGEEERRDKLPDEVKETDAAMYESFSGVSETRSMVRNMNENAQRVLDNSRLGNTPILILSSDSTDEWAEVQNQLAEWSLFSRQVTLEDSSHYIHWSNIEETKKEILDFISDKL